MKMKKCSRCRKSKTQTQFNKNKDKPNRLRSECKLCQSADSNIWYQKNKNKESYLKRRQRERLKQRYGNVDYENLFNKQNGTCAICGKPEIFKSINGKTVRLSVDHNHKTGQIRGLLCKKCNIGIGYFEDNIKYLKKALIYLNQYSQMTG